MMHDMAGPQKMANQVMVEEDVHICTSKIPWRIGSEERIISPLRTDHHRGQPKWKEADILYKDLDIARRQKRLFSSHANPVVSDHHSALSQTASIEEALNYGSIGVPALIRCPQARTRASLSCSRRKARKSVSQWARFSDICVHGYESVAHVGAVGRWKRNGTAVLPYFALSR